MDFVLRLFSKVFGALISKIQNEPVFLSGLVLLGINTAQQAAEGGLGPEDAILAGVFVVVSGLARELVWPAVKIDAATQTPLAPAEPLEAPFTGSTD